ncbi:TauD/TfdA family dioxygenase [Umezawaea endophytica]|uniref:TauD/TfdA family dioxygenase n=1 Tax=Umezawaea endophytica TaxID=1654476 RepID=A0A9X3AF68_9PSEU|nr:TauD/TfdA family dioxygenase [Umezawaea endophytica]MCS7476820.1 TauD/TfdA family dioxygenase [Umezawaea endophytica]
MAVKETLVTPDVAEVRAKVEQDGFALVRGLGGQRNAIPLLQALGTLLPQYKGGLEHDVTYVPGFEGKSYSQSVNTILAHTEAPGWDPSPRYLALYCHHQARCGGGYTDLFDGRRLIELLAPEEIRLLTDHPITFPGPGGGVRTSLFSGDGGRAVLRFSYNLLTTGGYDPDLDRVPAAEELPLGQAGGDLAEKVSALFAEHRTPLLIPDDALLVWDNQRMLHARSEYADQDRHLVRYWIADR